ncbi:MAG TPA: toll/interleukin-1 receptor domain-containing protein [Thermoanaerobaculia bacterium]
MPTNSETDLKVFLSYAREDLPVAEMLYADLQRAGVNVWMDVYDILPGQKWEDEIQRAMETATHYLLLLSAKSVSKRGFVQREVKKALVFAEEFPDSQICLIPVLLSRCQPSNLGLKKYQWVELFRSYELGLQQILRGLKPEFVSKIEVHAPRVNFRLASLATAGWGVIFCQNVPAGLREALAPLLDLRREQATRRSDLYMEFIGPNGYRKDETALQFLGRVGIDLGFMDVKKVPFYLLIIGPPSEIPFSFQFNLASSYAVGRLDFDEITHYAHYARSVVEFERSFPSGVRQQLVIFSPNHQGDPATERSYTRLSQPLAQALKGEMPDWEIDLVDPQEAIKTRLVELHSREHPGILCFAGHGVPFPFGDVLQALHQGALLCQDWLGTETRDKISSDHYMAVEDLQSTVDLEGFIGFYSSCYSAGTPETSDFFTYSSSRKTQIAPMAFVSPLAKRMLGSVAKPALAVIGHIDKLWSTSFVSLSRDESQLSCHVEMLKAIMQGYPVGFAMRRFHDRYTTLCSVLVENFWQREWLEDVYEFEFERLNRVVVDARNYVLIGDPAVRLGSPNS